MPIQCTQPVGAISLHGYCAGVSNETIFGESYVFRLVRYGTALKYFAAIDFETAGQWVKALNQSATRINQVFKQLNGFLILPISTPFVITTFPLLTAINP
jgi:hypothetical protein